MAQFRLFPLAMADETAELVAEGEYNRLKADPSIAVYDIESALNRYFTKVGYRNLQEVLDVIKESGLRWKGAGKALPK